MIALASDSALMGLSLRTLSPDGAASWLRAAYVVKSIIPAIWLGFSLTYSRSNYREFLKHWTLPLLVVTVVPVTLSLAFYDELFTVIPAAVVGGVWRLKFGAAATVLNALLLVALVLVVMNLEQTFRAAVGTTRWRIKFVVLAVAVIFGARFYVRSQGILFSTTDSTVWMIEVAGLLVGCLFLAVAYARDRLAEADVYPSLSILRSSVTILLVGAYLLVVGVLAQYVTRFGGAEIFELQATVVLIGMSGLAVLLLSERARQTIHAFVLRHFSKAQHDSVQIWTSFSRQLAKVQNETDLAVVSAKLIAETFDVLSVTVWLVDAATTRLAVTASTGQRASGHEAVDLGPDSAGVTVEELRGKAMPFNLEAATGAWAETLRRLNPSTFRHGGDRLCVPLSENATTLGVIVLADRVNGRPYTSEELELLKCIADHMTSLLQNIRLGAELGKSKELEAFRTMSAFFVHDLKNAAASLNLMLKNLPVHFDDPAFRADALRGIGNTAHRIDEMINRLSTLRQRQALALAPADLNQLVEEALNRIAVPPDINVTRELQPVPEVSADRDQLQSVVTNLVINAREAVGAGGRIRVRTERLDGRVVFSVTDNGCGMSPAFIRESLFKPFQSTKKKGLGIGLFQSRAIVQAHGGGMHVESETGKGTTFAVHLPIRLN